MHGRGALALIGSSLSEAPTPSPAAADLARTLRSTIPALEGVRGVAILTVLAHQLCIDGYDGSHAGGAHLVQLVRAPFQAGWAGVQLFFVLSGFLITGILLDTRRADHFWSSFYVRRALRIFPLYYFVLVATFVVAPLVVHLPDTVLAEHRHQLLYWLYLANVPSITDSDTLGHCWSLSVEEQFYVLWPFAVRFLDQRGLVRLCLAAVVGAFCLRLGLCATGANPELAYELLPARVDALAMGALAAIVIRRRDWLVWVAPRLGRALASVTALLVVIAVASGMLSRINPLTQTVGYTVLAAASALFILEATLQTARGHGRLARLLSSPLLRRYGKYSYAIYLFHHPLNLFISRRFFAPRLASMSPGVFLALQAAYFLAGSAAMLLLGALSYRLLEKPFLDLRRYFMARAAPSPSA